MTRRVTVGSRAMVAVGLAAACLVPASASAHHPDPTFDGALFEQDQLVEYKWRSGQVPPTWMKLAINRGAEDSNESRRSRAAVFAYDAGGSSIVAYDEPTPCGAVGAACANRSGAPQRFDLWFRRHGWMFDWGQLRWCQAYTEWPAGCYDAEAIALHEFGHAQILAHHEVYRDESDYKESVMNRMARSKPQPFYNMHAYSACDVATLQREYDVPTWATKIAFCQSLDTYLTLDASDQSIAYRGPVTFTAFLRITDADSYGRLGYDPLAQRSVTLQKRIPGTSTWLFVTHMTDLPSNVGYSWTETPSTTYEWRAVFLEPDDEGVQGAISPILRVTVGECTGSPCPQSGGSD